MVILEKEYDGDLYDVARDIEECFDPEFNPTIDRIPVDGNGFFTGKFTIKITWSNE